MKQAGVGIAGLLSSNRARVANTALICEEEHFSYVELVQRVESVCGVLSALGVTSGMTIGSLGQSALLNLLLLHALPRLGCSFLPLDSTLPDTSLRRFLELGETDMLVTAEPVSPRIASIDPQRLLAAEQRENSRDVPWAPLPAAEPHWLVCTSGTQGDGKLVVLAGDQLLSSVQASRERLPIKGSDSWLLCLPMFHVAGLMIPLRCAEAGAALVLHEKYDPVQLWEDLHKYDVTHVSLVPAMLAHLLDRFSRHAPPPRLRVVLIGGGALPAELAREALAAGWPICPSYGMTETASQVATLYPPPARYIEGMVGQPLSHLKVKINPGSGCIMIRGDSVMEGYAGEQTRNDGWLETRDLGRLDEQGNLVVLGRADDMFVSGGENVHPWEVEQVLIGCPGILEVAVTAVADITWGDRLVALYVGDLPGKQLREWSQAHLPGYMRPRGVIKVENLPRTALGKLQRKVLPDLYVSEQSGAG